MIRVLLAEDMHVVRSALAALLAAEPDLDVVAQVSDGGQVVNTVAEHRPDVAVLDIGLPGRDGLEVAADLRRSAPECRVLVLTAYGRPEAVRRAMSAGVAGFVLKDDPSVELADAIRRVANGERVLAPALAASAIAGAPNPLSARETAVLEVAAEGAEVAEIAGRLHLSKGTVRNYLGTIVTKLDARNRIDAIRIATEAGWL